MAMEFGLSFSPTNTNPNQQNAQAQSNTPIQDAIKTLSLRIPQFRNPGGIAPLPLLNAPGSGGVMPGQMPGQMPGGLQQIFAQLFGNQGQQGHSAPMPNILPGAGPSVPEQPVPYQPPSQTPAYGFSDPQVPQQDNSGHFFPGNWGRG